MRYSQKPFPSYRFVPGRTPHPTRDPLGHSYDLKETTLTGFDPECWFECEMYLYGIDLFNHHYWWEAHEAWEIVWKCVPRHSQSGLFLQGLIQITAAMLKTDQGLRHASERLARGGTEKLGLAGNVYFGVNIPDFNDSIRAHVVGKSEHPPSINLAIPPLLAQSRG